MSGARSPLRAGGAGTEPSGFNGGHAREGLETLNHNNLKCLTPKRLKICSSGTFPFPRPLGKGKELRPAWPCPGRGHSLPSPQASAPSPQETKFFFLSFIFVLSVITASCVGKVQAGHNYTALELSLIRHAVIESGNTAGVSHLLNSTIHYCDNLNSLCSSNVGALFFFSVFNLRTLSL